MLFAALFLFILAIILLWLSSRQRKQAGLPGGRIIYTDTRAWGGNGARLENTLMGGMLKYQDGGYALGVEYWANKTTWSTSATTDSKTDAMQVIATAAYFF